MSLQLAKGPSPAAGAEEHSPQQLQRKCACASSGASCARCSHYGSILQRKALGGGSVTGIPSHVHDVLNSPGSPLDAPTRAFMEPRFGRDLSSVRIHSDASAQQSAGQLRAAAYTVGNDIVFGDARLRSNESRSHALLAHELSHVVQQSGGDNHPFVGHETGLEDEADRAAASVMRKGSANVRPRGLRQLSRMTSEEAQRKLWSLVPDVVKPIARPIAAQARASIDSVVPRQTELPKEIEAVVNRTADVAAVISGPPLPAAAKPAQKAESQAPQKAAPAPQAAGGVARTATADSAVKKGFRDSARGQLMSTLGTVKGVLLEGTQILDSVIWVGDVTDRIADAGVEKALDWSGADTATKASVLTVYRNTFSSYATVREVAKKSGWVDETTGALNVSGKFAGAFDSASDYVEEHTVGKDPHADEAIFTDYELGELTGAIGTQVALAYVGVEEVEVVLKGLSVIGAVKTIVESVQRNPKNWQSSPDFWLGILNAALLVIGLKQTRAAQRLSRFLMAAGALGQAIPAVLNLATHYADPQLAQDPARRHKVLAQDYGALVKIVANVLQSMIHQAKTGKGPTGPHQEEAELPPATPTTVKPVGGPLPPPEGHVADPHAAAPATHATNTPDGDPHSGTASPAKAAPHKTEQPESVVAVRPEDAKAHKDTANGHEVVVTKTGVGVCSPPPCPVIHVEYAAELKANKELRSAWETVQRNRKAGNYDHAAELADTLVKNLEQVRANSRSAVNPPGFATPAQRAEIERLTELASTLSDRPLDTGRVNSILGEAKTPAELNRIIEQMRDQVGVRTDLRDTDTQNPQPEGTDAVGATSKPRTSANTHERVLGRGMEAEGGAIPLGHDRHHIALKAGGGEVGDQIREILQQANVSIDDPANGIPLAGSVSNPREVHESSTPHSRVHTQQGQLELLQALRTVQGDADAIRDVLRNHGQDLYEGRTRPATDDKFRLGE